MRRRLYHLPIDFEPSNRMMISCESAALLQSAQILNENNNNTGLNGSFYRLLDLVNGSRIFYEHKTQGYIFLIPNMS